MDFNQSEELYFIITTTANVSLFLIVVLPTLILCLLCALALLLAEDIDWQMRILLNNIFVAEISFWLGIAVYLLGYPMRAKRFGNEEASCGVMIGLLIVGGMQQLTAITLYAISVYIFLKYGTQKLKWCFINLYLIISWAVAVSLGLLPHVDAFGVNGNNGFCDTDAQMPLFTGYLALASVTAAVLLVVMVVFGSLTYCYIKRNALQGSSDIKKAVTNYLRYLIIATALSVLSDLAPFLFPFISALFNVEGLLEQTVIGLMWIIAQLPLAITPIASIIILKPIQLALKQIFRKCTCTYRQTDNGSSLP